MARTKNKGRRSAQGTAKADKPQPAVVTDVGAIIDKSHILLAQSNFDLAIQFLTRALELDPSNLEARELLGVAELEGGDPAVGREHLLQLFPPHTAQAPSEPSAYLYLAQTAEEPHEALGYYSTATAMIENRLGMAGKGKGKGKGVGGEEGEGEEEERGMAVTALVAMIEIWMSDLCFEDAASSNCDALIARALAVAPKDPEVLMTLASIRMSQSKFDEAKAVVLQVYQDIEGRDPFDPLLPGVPVRLQFSRLLLEHNLHLEALDVISTVREEDSLEVEAAYLEGWAWHLRAEAVRADPSLLYQVREGGEAKGAKDWSDMDADSDIDDLPLTADECLSESMRALLECAKLYTEQEYPDEGIGSHVADLLKDLEERGTKPAVHEIEEDDGDVEME